MIQGSRDFHILHGSLQRDAVEDAQRTGSRRLQEAIASPLHGLFYDPVPQFGYATFTWSAENSRSLNLHVPVAVDIGLVHLGHSWWDSLLKAYQSEDSEAKDRLFGRLSSLLAIDVTWKALGSPEQLGSAPALAAGGSVQ